MSPIIPYSQYYWVGGAPKVFRRWTVVNNFGHACLAGHGPLLLMCQGPKGSFPK